MVICGSRLFICQGSQTVICKARTPVLSQGTKLIKKTGFGQFWVNKAQSLVKYQVPGRSSKSLVKYEIIARLSNSVAATLQGVVRSLRPPNNTASLHHIPLHAAHCRRYFTDSCTQLLCRLDNKQLTLGHSISWQA